MYKVVVLMLVCSAQASAGSLILAGLGVGTGAYNPAVEQETQTVTLDARAVYVGLSPVGHPLLFLLSDHVQGYFETQCEGSIGAFALSGVLHWSDFSSSSFNISNATLERVEGNSVSMFSGHIVSGKYVGKIINRLGIKLGSQPLACLTEGGVSSSTGASILELKDA